MVTQRPPVPKAQSRKWSNAALAAGRPPLATFLTDLRQPGVGSKGMAVVGAHDARHRSPGTGGLGAGLHRGEKIAIAGGEWRFGKPSLDAQAAPPCAHESLVSR